MKKVFIALMAVVALASCSKKDDDNSSIEGFPKKVTTTYQGENRARVAEYNVQNGKVVSGSMSMYENGVQTGTTETVVFEYEGNLLKQQKEGTPSSEYYVVHDFHYDAQGRLVKKTSVSPNGGGSDNRTFEYTYSGNQLTGILSISLSSTYMNGQRIEANRYEQETLAYSGNTVIVTKSSSYRDGNGAVISGTNTYTDTITYTISDGNVIKKVEGNSTIEYSYDNSPNFNTMIDLYRLLDPDYFLNPNYAKNNLIEKKQTHKNFGGGEDITTTTFEITYNEKGYISMRKNFVQHNNEVKKLVEITTYEY